LLALNHLTVPCSLLTSFTLFVDKSYLVLREPERWSTHKICGSKSSGRL
jgi:hypothetical protein